MSKPPNSFGARMQTSETPPSRKSIFASGEVKPFGPHHFITLSESDQCFQTSATGASKVRVRLILFASEVTVCSCDMGFALLVSEFGTKKVAVSRAKTTQELLKAIIIVPRRVGFLLVDRMRTGEIDRAGKILCGELLAGVAGDVNPGSCTGSQLNLNTFIIRGFVGVGEVEFPIGEREACTFHNV